MKTHESPQRINILLVVDNEHDRASLRQIPNQEKVEYSITDCSCTNEAFSTAAKDCLAFDVVVVNHHPPCLDGLELCRKVLAAAIPLPLVILVGSGLEGIAAEALKAGVNDYIIKDPYNAYLGILPYVLIRVVASSRERRLREEATLSLCES